MKYTTPSIEVVNFNSSDAPRIGMQWWAIANSYGMLSPGSWVAAPAGYTPTNPTLNQNTDLTLGGVPCTAVDIYSCNAEIANIPGAIQYSDGTTFVADDGQSC